MNLREFVAQKFQTDGFDGLFLEDGCGCRLDDLMPCDEPSPNCQPGYQCPCDGTCDDPDICRGHLTAIKPETTP